LNINGFANGRCVEQEAIRMTESDSKDRVARGIADVTEGLATERRGEPSAGPEVPATPPQLVGARQGSTDSPQHAVVSLIRGRLDEHPHFRGRACLLQIEKVGESIVLSGRLPSYYLKQLLQEAVKAIPDVASIDNRVDVVWPTS
jgi:hypothetical protein